jgi:hypothetical protein
MFRLHLTGRCLPPGNCLLSQPLYSIFKDIEKGAKMSDAGGIARNKWILKMINHLENAI